MTTNESTIPSSIQVQPWATEKPLTLIVAICSGLMWLLLLFTIFGFFYALMFAVIFFFAHVAFIYHVRGNAIRLGPDQFPDLYQSVETLSQRMGFAKTPEAYLIQEGGALNALATKFFKSEMIVLFSDLIEACGENKAARDMIVAHELGHLKEGHLRWHWFLLPGLLFPFLGQALSRAREYTCDRYGIAGSGDPKGALVGLAILAAGGKKGPEVNLQAMARQVEHLNTGWMTLGEWLATHPPLSKRVIALEPGLKPSFNYTQSGVLKALGILGLIYVVPSILIGMGIAAFTFYNLSKTKGLLGKKGGALTTLERAENDVLALSGFIDEEIKGPKGLPEDQDDLYRRWAVSHPENPDPKDPFSGVRYRFEKVEDDFDIWSVGPDGVANTEDDFCQHGLKTADEVGGAKNF